MIVNITRNLVKYSKNQKTMEQKDENIAILKRFDLVTKQVFYQQLAKHNLSEKGLYLNYTIVMSIMFIELV